MWLHSDPGREPLLHPDTRGHWDIRREGNSASDSLDDNEDIGIPLDTSKNHLHVGEFSDNFSELYINITTDNLDLAF